MCSLPQLRNVNANIDANKEFVGSWCEVPIKQATKYSAFASSTNLNNQPVVSLAQLKDSKQWEPASLALSKFSKKI